MDISKLWKSLTDAEQRAWRVWAKNNSVITDAGEPTRVNAFGAFEAVLKRRALAAEPLNPTTPPTEAKWIGAVLSLRDAGPFTTGEGYFGFRAESNIATDTCWFVWATPPIDESESEPEQLLQFVTQFRAMPMKADEVTENLGPAYRAVLGSWAGPGEEGAWPTRKYVWVRLHEYIDGQLGPAVLLRGRIQVEL
jgi:hypothetical protein